MTCVLLTTITVSVKEGVKIYVMSCVSAGLGNCVLIRKCSWLGSVSMSVFNWSRLCVIQAHYCTDSESKAVGSRIKVYLHFYPKPRPIRVIFLLRSDATSQICLLQPHVVQLLPTAITETSQTAEIFCPIDSTCVVNKAVLLMAHELLWHLTAAGTKTLYTGFFIICWISGGRWHSWTALNVCKGRVVCYYREKGKCCLQWLLSIQTYSQSFCLLLAGDFKGLWRILQLDNIDPITLRWCLALPKAPKRFIRKC